MTQRALSIAAAAAITAGAIGVSTLGAPASANAAPGCVEWVFPIQNTVLASGGVRLSGENAPTNDDWSWTWTNQNPDQKVYNASGTLTGFRDKPPLPGNTFGSIVRNADNSHHLNFHFDSNDGTVSLTLNGQIGPEGNVIEPSETGGGPISWRMAGPFVCKTLGDDPNAMAPKVNPEITSDEVIGGIVIHVKNNTGDTTKCKYDSEVIDRDFTLEPNKTTDLRLVPAVPLLRTWPVTVTCDNGTSATADIDF